MQKTQDYISEHKSRFIEELMEWLKIPSVSADPKFDGDVANAAEFIKVKLIDAGAENCVIMPTKGHPVVYGEKMIDPAAPTVLVYGHYDVQPADPVELWDSGPFDPVIKKTDLHPDGAIFARGACDDKGQVYLQVKAFEAMMKTGELPCNVKFLIEGEEEVGSPSLGDFCKEHKDLLKCDCILVSDTSILANDLPCVTIGLRGLSYIEVEVQGPSKDLHSGVYGGAIMNPANVLAQMLGTLQDEVGCVTIPGFYDDVDDVSADERAAMQAIPLNVDDYKKDLEVNGLTGDPEYSVLERVGIRPALDVNGIWGGYTGEGAKTVLPAKATAKLSARLVPNQSSDKMTELLCSHLQSIAPKGVNVKCTPMHGGNPYVMPVDTPEYQAAEAAMETTFAKKPVPLRTGGSIPILSLFEEVLGVKSVLIGFGLDSDSIHSPNEHFGLWNFEMGLKTIPHFYKEYKNLKK